ncbi:MAG TPA: iron ABC transporter permease, partial [Beijerinckiaceae bacterium]|nr:iron ABC transporter permease [Beijerinckiaceae bacterium]
MSRAARTWLALAWAGYAVLPWYPVAGLSGYPFGEAGSGLGLGLAGRAAWLLPFLVPLSLATLPPLVRAGRATTARRLVLAGLL